MAYKIRASGKAREFKKSDELAPALDSLGDTMRRYGAPLLIAAGLLLLVGGGALGYFFYQRGQENDAAAIAYEATLRYRQVPGTEEGEKKKPEPTQAENFKQALDLFSEVVDKYPGTRSAAISQYYIGNSHLELGQYDQAVSAYQTFLDRFHPSAVMTALALQRMGVAYESKGDKNGAEEAYQRALNVDGAMNKDQVLFALGGVLEAENKKEDAVAQYKRLLKDYPVSVLIPDTRTRLKGLGVEPQFDTGAEPKAETQPEIKSAPTAASQNTPKPSEGKK